MITRPWKLPLLAAGLLGSVAAFAGDIGSDISRGQHTSEGGYFEIGTHLLVATSPIVGAPKKGESIKEAAISFNGRYQWGPGFFEIETYSSDKATSQVTAGVNILNNQTWWLDAIVTQFHQELDIDDNTTLRNSSLQNRKGDLPIGLRATGYVGNTLVQVTFLSGDLRDEHDGYVISSELGRAWQNRNMNYHWLVGAIYESAKVTQYYFGVDGNQADVNFPAYQADDSVQLFAELGLTYVLAEDWILRSSARYTKLTEQIEDSPIIDEDYASIAALSLSYVF